MMKDEDQVSSVLEKIDTTTTEYPGMTFEQGVEEALLWVLGELPDDEFPFS